MSKAFMPAGMAAKANKFKLGTMKRVRGAGVQASNTAQSAKGAYQGASPGVKRAVGFGAVTAGGVGAAGGGYALGNRKNKKQF